MARSSDINQRIILTGADEVRRHLEAIAAAGERSGNTIRQTLLAATQGATNFTRATQESTRGTRNMQFALTNLGFQVNDVVSGFASGQDALRIFAQQGGQIFQIFQQAGPGFFTQIGTSIASMVTPMRLAAAAGLAVAGAVALIASRAAGTEASIRQFNVVLKGMGDTSGVTGKELETVAENLREVGLTTDEARQAILLARRSGFQGTAQQFEDLIKTGADLNAVLGEGSLQKYIAAASAGGEQLETFAKGLGGAAKSAALAFGNMRELQKQTDAATQATQKFNLAVQETFQQRAESVADLARNQARQFADVERQRQRQDRPETDPRRLREREDEDAARQHQRQLEDIQRATNRRLNELIAQRNRENAAQLAAYNKQIADSAAAALAPSRALIDIISKQVSGQARASLSEIQKAALSLSVAWQRFLDTLAQSGFIDAVLRGLTAIVNAFTQLLTGEFSITALSTAFLALIPVVLLVGKVIAGLIAFIGGPVGLLVAIGLVIVAFTDWGKAWKIISDTAAAFWKLLVSFYDWLVTSFVDGFNWVVAQLQAAWDGLVKFVTESPIFRFLERVIKKAGEAAAAIRKAVGGGAVTPTMSMAQGGLVYGPGTGTSDSVAARLSAGEFVMPANATRAFLPMLEAMRAMRAPVMPTSRRPRGFATGGLVGAGGGGGAAVHLHIGGRDFPLSGDRDVVDALMRTARRSSMLSAGRKPSTA